MDSTHIVIVNYNAGKWLQRSVLSALQYSTGKVTVVDNNSSDDSVFNVQQVVINEPRLQWIINQQNRGFASANNQVLKEVDGDIVVLMNPDCELNADTLAKTLSVFEKYPDVAMASCRILNDDGSVQASCRRRFPTPWSALVRLLQLHRVFPNNPKFTNFDYGDLPDKTAQQEVEFVEAVSGAFMLVRRQAMQQVGLLDEAYFMHCEDLDWCKRFELAGWKTAFVPQASVLHAKGVSSQSRPIAVLWSLHKGMNRFFDKFYKQQSNFLLRYIVKLGILFSFMMRSLLSFFRGFIS